MVLAIEEAGGGMVKVNKNSIMGHLLSLLHGSCPFKQTMNQKSQKGDSVLVATVVDDVGNRGGRRRRSGKSE